VCVCVCGNIELENRLQRVTDYRKRHAGQYCKSY